MKDDVKKSKGCLKYCLIAFAIIVALAMMCMGPIITSTKDD